MRSGRVPWMADRRSLRWRSSPSAQGIMDSNMFTGNQKWRALLSTVLATVGSVSCDDNSPPACEETTEQLADSTARGPFSFSLKEGLEEISPLSERVAWSNLAPEDLAGQETNISVELIPVEGSVVAVKAINNAVDSNNPYACKSHLLSEVTIHLSTDDGALDEVLVGAVKAFERVRHLEVSALLAAPAFRGAFQAATAPDEMHFRLFANEGEIVQAYVGVEWEGQNDGEPATGGLLLAWGPEAPPL